jgi:GrpB-like predicted nucleotidyltransferase (UPF0157 family)
MSNGAETPDPAEVEAFASKARAHLGVTEHPVELQPVAALAATIRAVLEGLRADLASLASLAPGVAVEHVGATALPDGLTKGDVDVALSVPLDRFGPVVEALTERFSIAQPQNWTATYASFADDGRDLPVGIQVSVAGSADDFLVALRDRFAGDASLRRRYDAVKTEAAPRGPAVYWEAKNAFLQTLLADLRP